MCIFSWFYLPVIGKCSLGILQGHAHLLHGVDDGFQILAQQLAPEPPDGGIVCGHAALGTGSGVDQPLLLQHGVAFLDRVGVDTQQGRQHAPRGHLSPVRNGPGHDAALDIAHDLQIDRHIAVRHKGFKGDQGCSPPF